jgi:hypothetical protein
MEPASSEVMNTQRVHVEMTQGDLVTGAGGSSAALQHQHVNAGEFTCQHPHTAKKTQPHIDMTNIVSQRCHAHSTQPTTTCVLNSCIGASQLRCQDDPKRSCSQAQLFNISKWGGFNISKRMLVSSTASTCMHTLQETQPHRHDKPTFVTDDMRIPPIQHPHVF